MLHANQIILISTYNMLKLFKKSFQKFLKIIFFSIVLITPIFILEIYYPNLIINLKKFTDNNTLALIIFRWSIILMLLMTWNIWIYKIANKYQWSGDKRRYWLSQRWKITGWLIIFELVICENILSFLI